VQSRGEALLPILNALAVDAMTAHQALERCLATHLAAKVPLRGAVPLV
jgi:hypothetical protein